MFNSGGPTGPSSPPDPKTMIMTLVLIASGILAFIGDQYSFVHAPPDVASKLVTIPTYVTFCFLQNRFAADGVALIFWLTLLVALGLAGYRLVVRYYLEPKEVKDYLRRKKRQEDLLSKHSD